MAVKVLRLNGSSLNMEAEEGWKISDIKAQISEAWNIPRICQRLCCSQRFLCEQDLVSDVLADYAPPAGESLVLSLVVSNEELFDNFTSEFSAVRADAIISLADVAKKGDSFAIFMLKVVAKDVEELAFLRAAALEGLARVAERGDECINAVRVCMKSGTPCQVRIAALNTFAILATSLDDSDRAAVVACVGHEHAEVSMTAANVLLQMVRKGDKQAIAAVHVHLQHRHPSVRAATVQALTGLATEADLPAMAALLEHPDWCTREAAADVLVRVATQGECHQVVIMLVIARLRHPDAQTRVAAVSVLPRLASKGDNETIDALRHCLKDENGQVRRVAKSSLKNVIEKREHIQGHKHSTFSSFLNGETAALCRADGEPPQSEETACVQ